MISADEQTQHSTPSEILSDAGFRMLDEHNKQLETIIADGNLFDLRTAQYQGLLKYVRLSGGK